MIGVIKTSNDTTICKLFQLKSINTKTFITKMNFNFKTHDDFIVNGFQYHFYIRYIHTETKIIFCDSLFETNICYYTYNVQ